MPHHPAWPNTPSWRGWRLQDESYFSTRRRESTAVYWRRPRSSSHRPQTLRPRPDLPQYTSQQHARRCVEVGRSHEVAHGGARECRMIRDLVLNSQTAEPAIRHVDRELATEHSLRADRKHIANDKHPDNQLWINRWPTSAGIIGCELLAYPRQIDKGCYFANQVIIWDSLFQRE